MTSSVIFAFKPKQVLFALLKFEISCCSFLFKNAQIRVKMEQNQDQNHVASDQFVFESEIPRIKVEADDISTINLDSEIDKQLDPILNKFVSKSRTHVSPTIVDLEAILADLEAPAKNLDLAQLSSKISNIKDKLVQFESEVFELKQNKNELKSEISSNLNKRLLQDTDLPSTSGSKVVEKKRNLSTSKVQEKSNTKTDSVKLKTPSKKSKYGNFWVVDDRGRTISRYGKEYKYDD